jgi:hypothetical protein
MADVVTTWNNNIAYAIRHDHTLPGPTYGSRTFAMVHAAIYDAINDVTRTHEPYLYDTIAPPGTSADAAASQAAHDVLAAIYPIQSATLDALLASSLAVIPDGTPKSAGIALGQAVAAAQVVACTFDNALDVVPYTPGTGPGEWRPAPPLNGAALGPGWGRVKPFVIRSGAQFRPPAQPDLTSNDYLAAFNEVKEVGELNSPTRTAEQTEIGIFWGYDRGGMGPPPILYNQIAQGIAADQGNNVLQNARMFALANLAQADGGIVCWEAKYIYNFWRPITAIREADTDGNAATIADATWEPLGAPGGVGPNFTPPFPAYTSGHATFGSSFFHSLALFYGTDDISFTAASDELPGVTRTFNSFSQVIEENGQSRIYLGIHWRFDKVFAISSGLQIANYVFAHALRPLNDGDMNKDGHVDGEDLILFKESWHKQP